MEVSSQLIDCNLTFTWTGVSGTSYDVLIGKDMKNEKWDRTNNTKYTVANVFQYDSITIEVRIVGYETCKKSTFKGKCISIQSNYYFR